MKGVQCPYNFRMSYFVPPACDGCCKESKKNYLTPEPHDTWNFSRARWGAHDPEKILDIALMVAEKIEFEKNWRPLAAEPEVVVVR